MKYPATVSVGPHEYELDLSAAAGYARRADGELGHTELDTFKISVDPDRPDSGVAETVLHEILHAIFRQAALGERPGLAAAEEHVVTAMAPLLLGVLRQNPELIRALQGRRR